MISKSRLDHLCEIANIPGIAYVQIAGAGAIQHGSSGMQSFPDGPAINEETIFEAASLSKPVFAYLVMQLVDQGMLALDKPLYQYWPYDDIAHDPRYQEITARMVLHHATGFPNWRGEEGLHIQFTPGSQFGYSGEGYVFLQKVVETIQDQPLHVVARERVFFPLGMKHSDFIWQPDFSSQTARPYDKEGKERKKWEPQEANAAGSLHTSVSDYGRFLQALLKGEGLSRARIEQMFTPYIMLPGQNRCVAWGLGFGLEQREGKWALWHWGSNGGYKSFCWADLASQSGFVMLTNSDNGLVIAPQMLQETVGGDHPSLDWLQAEYEYQYLQAE